MPEKIELTEEEIKAQEMEFMNAPIQVWRPKSQRDSKKSGPTEIYVMGNNPSKEEEEAEMEYWPKETQPEDGKSDGDQDGDYLILG